DLFYAEDPWFWCVVRLFVRLFAFRLFRHSACILALKQIRRALRRALVSFPTFTLYIQNNTPHRVNMPTLQIIISSALNDLPRIGAGNPLDGISAQWPPGSGNRIPRC